MDVSGSVHAVASETAAENLNYMEPILECDSTYLQEELAVGNLKLEESADEKDKQHSDERTIINFLQSQVKTLQEKLNSQIKESEYKIQSYEELLLERENEIFNLKHRINEEIEEKQVLKSRYSDKTSKLNNEINELEQIIQDNVTKLRQVIEAKNLDIQILQEQKLSLLQSLTNEITKLNNANAKLISEIKTEQQLKQNVKDWYEYKLMRMNEKVLNRNNELVELQDGILGKGETIEHLQMELKKERELSKKYLDDLAHVEQENHQLENILQKKSEEILTLQRNLPNDAENGEHVCRKEDDSKKPYGTESRKRLPLQDASNFADNRMQYSKEKYNIEI